MADETEFLSIRITHLRGDLKIPFDVFVRVAGKHILYCRSGSSFEGDRLERLKAKNLKAIFIKQDDELVYRQYLESNIDSAYNDRSKDLQTRMEVIQGFQQSASDHYMENPGDKHTYDHLVSSAERFVNLLANETRAVAALIAIPNVEKSITHHGVNVATLATAMAVTEFGKDARLTSLMAAGSLVHDLEHVHAGFEVAIPPSKFTDETKAIYRTHPLKGAARIQNAKFVDPLVINIIAQHEEHIDGSGFPKGLMEKQMDPLVMLVAAANAYDRLINFENLDPKLALKKLLIDKMGCYPLQALQGLQNVLKSAGIV